MNKVTSINLHGIAFQLEEDGYDELRDYLDDAARALKNNPDKPEIIADIEQAIADKFKARLTSYRNVVLTADVIAVIAEIGPLETGTAESTRAGASSQSEANPAPFTTDARPRHRLYRLTDGAMLAGVCNGLAAYLGLDVTWVRLAVAALIFLSAGTVIIAYLVAIVIIPKAVTPGQKAAASGATDTAHDFIRMAQAGYYEGMRKITDPQARREWKRKFKREMRDWKDKFR